MYYALFLLCLGLFACKTSPEKAQQVQNQELSTDSAWQLSPEQWQKRLSPQAYQVLREHGTEPAFSGSLLKEKRQGTYTCGGCGQALFDAKTKFDSGTGWPSFFQPASKQAISEISDESYGMKRTEVRCSRCGGHLGHVFDDGPKPTGQRYCINSLALGFEAKD